ncbi:hypothetical protein [Aliivibrio sp. SR45-2]|uniref:hypothetical protein n=1 Tax=Aliivibrio sp. SR45-2 TaxID=2760931 RepID=UPI000AC2FAAF|nr:hypothetical protein [Aliivibrio sp. SR45-2]MBB1315950.1 hypothetical protein [Aliivibrio sp. SR45-2]
MIGWKVLYKFNENEVVCEIVGQIVSDGAFFAIPVYHDGCIKMAWFSPNDEVKVIERK